MHAYFKICYPTNNSNLYQPVCAIKTLHYGMSVQWAISNSFEVVHSTLIATTFHKCHIVNSSNNTQLCALLLHKHGHTHAMCRWPLVPQCLHSLPRNKFKLNPLQCACET